MFSYGFYHDYLAILNEDETITVKVEKELSVDSNVNMEDEIKKIFGENTFIEYYMPGELHYPGHGLRFLKER